MRMIMNKQQYQKISLTAVVLCCALQFPVTAKAEKACLTGRHYSVN